MSTQASATKSKVQVETVTIRFVGDSGDGMQLTGTEFMKANAIAGNDLATFPDYPAEILHAAVDLGGTITGEHGVGLAKRDFLEYEQGPEVVALERRIKAVFDPLGILNPGKIFPER